MRHINLLGSASPYGKKAPSLLDLGVQSAPARVSSIAKRRASVGARRRIDLGALVDEDFRAHCTTQLGGLRVQQ